MKFNLESGPFIKTNLTKSKITRNIIYALIPIIVYSFFIFGIIPFSKGQINILGLFKPLIFIITGMISAYIVEYIFAKIFLKRHNNYIKDYMKSSDAILTGLLISLIIPINASIYMLIIGVILATFIKIILGGSNKCIINPSVIGIILIILIFGNTISLNGGYIPNFSKIDATPLTTLQANDFDVNSLSNFSFKDLLINNNSGTMATICPILIIFALIFLSLTKSIKWRISISYILTFMLMTFIYGIINNQLTYPLYQVLTGSILFGAVFLATNTIASPKYTQSQYLYGILLGIITVIIRQLTNIVDGVMISILIANLTNIIFDYFNLKYYFKKELIVIPIVIIIVLGILPFKIENIHFEYEITDKNVTKNVVVYEATTNVIDSDINIRVIINSGVIKNISFDGLNDNYSKHFDSRFANELINNQENINNTKDIKGYKLASVRVKKLINVIINDYNSSNYGYIIKKD